MTRDGGALEEGAKEQRITGAKGSAALVMLCNCVFLPLIL
jgi:hypothetical protein